MERTRVLLPNPTTWSGNDHLIDTRPRSGEVNPGGGTGCCQSDVAPGGVEFELGVALGGEVSAQWNIVAPGGVEFEVGVALGGEVSGRYDDVAPGGVEFEVGVALGGEVLGEWWCGRIDLRNIRPP